MRRGHGAAGAWTSRTILARARVAAQRRRRPIFAPEDLSRRRAARGPWIAAGAVPPNPPPRAAAPVGRLRPLYQTHHAVEPLAPVWKSTIEQASRRWRGVATAAIALLMAF